MTARKDQTHRGICRLADHLDAALAIGEDLLTERERLPRLPRRNVTAADVKARLAALRRHVESIRTLEVLLVGRAMAARTRAHELRHIPLLRPLASLFRGGTAPLVDAVAEYGDATDIDFDTGDSALTFLRQRGLIGEGDSIEQLDLLVAGESYLVARRIHLGTLLDLLATFLDTLDRHFELYDAEQPGAESHADGRPRTLAGALAEMRQAP